MIQTGPGISPAPARSLRAVETAQASVMAALCAATAIIAVVVPFADGLALLGTVPMGLLSYRYRLRVVISATVAAGTIAFLVAGLGGLLTVFNSAYIGGLTGVIKRHRRGLSTVIAAAMVAGLVFGAAVVIALAVLSRLRNLVFDAISGQFTGIAAALDAVPPLQDGAAMLRAMLQWALRYWPVWMAANVVFSVMMVSLIGWWALSRVLDRLRGIPDVHKLDTPGEGVTGTQGAPAPLPTQLIDARFRYPNARTDALGPVSLDINPGEHVAIAGANGSGKTTLMLLLAGREPTGGSVRRPGAVGLGAPGGTAVVMQHPESQVLGCRVVDDVVWGLPPKAQPDITSLLREVGLDGFADRDTGGLSGGELQRLAIAAALARDPALLIADEVTSMVDPAGREKLIEVLSGLSGRHRTALVHITHYDGEAGAADRVVRLGDAGDNTEMVRIEPAPGTNGKTAPGVLPGPAQPTRRPVFELRDVGHDYDSGTPWVKTALADVSLTVEAGDGLLIHGGNGSGKSTLAWIMAGLTTPTAGQCLVDGHRADQQVGSVALSFQAARLQLMRSHVGLDVASAGGFSPRDGARIGEALTRVGLDASLAWRRIDQLSGGQMRRVVLAGLLAGSPRALILDEPLAGLDAVSRSGLLRLLEGLRRDTGLTVVVISHDFADMAELCPRTVRLHGGRLVTIAAAGESSR